MSSNPIPRKQDLAQDLRRVATTLTDDAQNAALRRCKELSFDTNKGLISLEETLINLSSARDILLDAVEKGKLIQLPLRLQYSLYEQIQRIAQQLTSLVNGTDEIVNLVNSVEDITASIWQYNLHNLSGEVLGLHNKMNQLKSQETRIRQVSREAEEFSALEESAKRSLGQISEIASVATALGGSLQNTADEIRNTLSKVSEQGQKVAGVAAQVDQHETTAMQQLAGAKQAAADTEVIAKKSKEMRSEIDTSREALQDLMTRAQELLSSTQTAASEQLSESKTQSDELVSTTTASVSTLTKQLQQATTDLRTKLQHY
jgi:chromosome segregation ATPase